MSPILLEDDRPIRHEWMEREWDGISRAEAMRRLLAAADREVPPTRWLDGWVNLLNVRYWLGRLER